MSTYARKRSDSKIYHIIVKSPSDILLFKEINDKIKYLRIIKYYKKHFNFKIYCYCLMDNHGHFLIDECDSSISIFMKLINHSYANYFNNKYNHIGRVFKNRFFSIPVKNDSYIIQLSFYIHKNPQTLYNFKDSPEKYPFSSLGIYLNLKKDYFNLIDSDRILNYFSKDTSTARNLYFENITT
ncbi:transposase [Clostridium senegalense]|uniref:transposase n=1 Tax=Clostridium senegalense TaxID=1465809 RepID=UPI001C124BC7|nr:transposase [Clostridium senegalense]MBU5228064.1 transposase [Clostridium senegalense]